VNPGHAALTLMPVDSRAEAKASVITWSAVYRDYQWLVRSFARESSARLRLDRLHPKQVTSLHRFHALRVLSIVYMDSGRLPPLTADALEPILRTVFCTLRLMPI
jgi:hypothetical protein